MFHHSFPLPQIQREELPPLPRLRRKQTFCPRQQVAEAWADLWVGPERWHLLGTRQSCVNRSEDQQKSEAAMGRDVLFSHQLPEIQTFVCSGTH